MNRSSSSWTDEQAEYMTLRQAGFDDQEIAGLCRLRRRWKQNEQDRLSLNPDPAHLHFLRWLVHKGKLAEDLS